MRIQSIKGRNRHVACALSLLWVSDCLLSSLTDGGEIEDGAYPSYALRRWQVVPRIQESQCCAG